MKYLDTYWWRGLDRFVGLEISEAAGARRYRLARIRHRGGNLILTDQQDTSEPEAIPAFLEKYPGLPVLINISGAMVMERVVRQSERGIFEVLGIPRGQERSFHVQYLFPDQTHMIGALIREEQLREILDLLGSARERAISVNLSPAIALYLLPQLGSLNGQAQHVEIRRQSYYLHTGVPVIPDDPKDFPAFDLSESARKAGIAGEDLVLAAHAMSYLYLPAQPAISDEVEAQQQTFFRQNTWKKVLGGATVTAGLLLLITLLTQITYQTSLGSLEKQYQASQEVLNQIQANRSMIADRETSVNRLVSSTLKSSGIAWVLDQLALHRPTDIAFLSCEYRPGKVRLQQLEAADRNGIDLILTGTAPRSSSISGYSLQLEQLPTIASVEIYRSNYLFQKAQFEFVLFLHLSTQP